uniref:Uncharacterized protein n=1 Tax=uncultured gamma proteobacterium HF0010_05D02 TaxID=710978 RepID=E0XQJ6_9GAMM|nr:hypothetical protein [uncultured gamma proteobacterium HF0010_05D02]
MYQTDVQSSVKSSEILNTSSGQGGCAKARQRASSRSRLTFKRW